MSIRALNPVVEKWGDEAISIEIFNLGKIAPIACVGFKGDAESCAKSGR